MLEYELVKRPNGEHFTSSGAFFNLGQRFWVTGQNVHTNLNHNQYGIDRLNVGRSIGLRHIGKNM